MRTSPRILFILPIVILLLPNGCKENDPTQPDTGLIEAVITHFGFDFSAGRSDTVEFNNNDGETIGWMPGGGTNPSYPSYGAYIWYRTETGSSANETRDMGIVELSSVTSVPSAWDVSPNIPPLLPGHVVVAACRDGFVKMKVMSVDTLGLWPARVQYVWSSTRLFAK